MSLFNLKIQVFLQLRDWFSHIHTHACPHMWPCAHSSFPRLPFSPSVMMICLLRLLNLSYFLSRLFRHDFHFFYFIPLLCVWNWSYIWSSRSSVIWSLLSLLLVNCFNLKMMVVLFSSFPKVLPKHSQFFLFVFQVFFYFFKSSSLHDSSLCLLQVIETPLLAPVSSCHGTGPLAPGSSGFWMLGQCSTGRLWERRLEFPL